LKRFDRMSSNNGGLVIPKSMRRTG
jgi:hypothetical protein